MIYLDWSSGGTFEFLLGTRSEGLVFNSKTRL